MYLLAPFILQNSKKFLEPIESYEDQSFSGPKSPICPALIFLVQTMYYYFHLLVILIVQNLKKKFFQWIQSYEDAPFLGPKWSTCHNFFFINIVSDFSLACSFRRMLMNHKNFCFTKLPDRNTNVIFLKSPKTLFLEDF